MNSARSSDVAVIIVNYNTAALTCEAVESVLARTHGGRRVAVHVVDNASPGGDAEILAAAHRDSWGSRVTLHLQATNLGFGRGNNVVLEALAATADPPAYVFLLNPDAQLANEAIGLLADFLDAHDEAAVAGCSLSRPDSDEQVSAAFRFPNLLTEFVGATNLGPVQRIWPNAATAMPTIGEAPVDWVSGAAFMARFGALREVGFFDRDYFLYFEEVDLMLRLKAGGWTTWYVPKGRVAHIAGAATGIQGGRKRGGRLPQYWYASWKTYHFKNYGRFVALGRAMARMAGWTINSVARAAQGRAADVPPGGPGDFVRYVIWPLLTRGRA